MAVRRLQLVLVCLVSLWLRGYSQWVQTNGPSGASITAMCTNGDVVFVGSYGSGVFVSTNEGFSWSGANFGMKNLRVLGLAASEGIVYAAGPGGLYSSSDNGKNWYVTGLGPSSVSVLSVAANGNNLIARVDLNGLYCSTDAGVTWRSSSNVIGGGPIITYGQSFYAGTSNGIYLSSNSGASWNIVDSGLTNTSVTSLASSGSTLFAGTGTGVFVSTDAGMFWRSANAGLSSLSVSAIGSGSEVTFAVTSGGVFRSTDNGGSWSAAGSGLGSAGITSFAFSGSTVLAAGSAGVFASTNNGGTWSPANAGIATTDVTSLAYDGKTLYAGLYPASVCASTDRGATWINGTTGPPGNTLNAILPSSGILLAATDSGVYRSTNAGAFWTASNVGLTSTSASVFAPSGPNVFVGTGTGVFVSTDNGTNWLPTGSLSGDSHIYSLAVSGDTVVAGTSVGQSGVYVSTNRGITWALTNSGLPSSNLNSLAIGGNTILAGTNSGAFTSTDNGGHWSPANSGLSASSVLSFTNGQGARFAGTNSGVFVSMNNGGGWVAVNTSIENTYVQALCSNDTIIFAGTNGQGVWRRSIADMIPIFSPNPTSKQIAATELGMTTVDSIEIRNLGGLPLVISQATGNNGFSLSPTSGTIPPMDSSKFYISFKPYFYNIVSPVNGQIVFTDNAPNSPQTYSVASWAFDTVFFASSHNLTFPGVAVGSSRVDSITVQNRPEDANTPLTISNVWTDDSLSYSVSPRAATLFDFQVAVFRFTFHPIKPGLAATNAYFQHTWGGPDTVTLSGYGLPVSPSLLSPSDGAFNQSRNLQLQWTALSGTDSYQVQLARDSLFLQLLVNDSSVTIAAKNITGLDTSTIYYWRVRGKNGGGWGSYSAFSRFTTVPLAPDAPLLASPQDSAKNLPRPVLVQWLASARGVKYRLRVSLSGDLSSPILDTVLTGLSYLVTTLDPDTTYYWGVTAANPGGDSPLATVRSFHTLPGAPASPVLFLPPNNATDQALSLTLVWHRTNKTDNYEVKLSDTLSFTRLLTDSVVVDTLLTVGALRNQQSFYWTVTSRNAGGPSAPSQPFTFVTVPYPPPAPMLLSPPDRDSTQPKIVLLRWNVVNGSSGYHVQLANDPTVPPPNPILNDSTLGSNVTRLDTVPSTGLTYYWRVRAKNTGGWGSFSQTKSFYVPALPQAPLLLSPADKSANQDPTGVSVGWNDVGAAHYHLRVSLSPTLLSAVFEDSVLTAHTWQVTGLAYNTTYYWSVRALSANGLASGFTAPAFSFTTSSSRAFVDTTVATFTTGTPTSSDYRMVSFPGSNGWIVNQLLSGTQKTDWRIFRDNGATPPNHLTELTSSSTLNAGEGFWLLKIGRLGFTQSVTMPTLDSAGTFSIPVRYGWNLIGNPFAASIPWTAVQRFNLPDTLTPPWTWNGQYDQMSSLDAFRGYYFYNRSATRSTLRLPYPFPGLQKTAASMPPVDWRIDISLTVGGHKAGTAWLGTSMAARQGYCALNEYHPPVILDQPDLYFHRPAWDSLYSRFSSDFRSRLDNGQAWDFVVSAPRMSSSSLGFSGVGTVPPGSRAVLVNLQNTSPIDIREHEGYPFLQTSDLMTFRLIVGSPEFVEEELEKLVPRDARLDQNFPNPFNPTTTITYGLPKTSSVELEVISLLGQRVAMLARGIQSAGTHTAVWDARDGNSRGVASGVYFARLTVNGNSVGIRKMILIR